MSAGLLEAIDEAIARSADADEALRDVVRVLAGQSGVSWAGIAFLEEGSPLLGPSAGTPDEARRVLATVCYKGEVVGELRVDGDVDRDVLELVADRIAAHVLLGWDTGGEAWEP